VPRTITETGQTLLADLPPYLSDDGTVQGVIDTLAREQQRITDAADGIRRTAFPSQADDTYNMLLLWETLLGLPVKPPGVPDDQRRSKVLASLQGRDVGTGEGWTRAVAQAVGTNWQQAENTPGPYQLTVTLPFAAGSYEGRQAENIIRTITPAHIDLLISYGTGFLIGVSIIGQDVL
jgi:uncharacterized protein YmfQ (DUF2313 family)